MRVLGSVMVGTESAVLLWSKGQIKRLPVKVSPCMSLWIKMLNEYTIIVISLFFLGRGNSAPLPPSLAWVSGGLSPTQPSMGLWRSLSHPA